MTLELLTAGGLEYTELAAELHAVVGKFYVSLEIRFPLRLSNSTEGFGSVAEPSNYFLGLRFRFRLLISYGSGSDF
jgi:hypothetical protein